MKILAKYLSLLILPFLLSNCGEEGSGNLLVKGAGSTTTARSLVMFGNELMGSVLEEADGDLLPTSGAISPANLDLKVYEFWISAAADCSNPILVFTDGNPSAHNVLGSVKPDLGKGSPPPGNYPCLIMVMSDNIAFTPTTSDGDSCVANVSATVDVCSAQSGGTYNYPDTLPSGSQGGFVDGSCSGNNEIVPVYLSTSSTQTSGVSGHNGFTPPTVSGDSTSGFKLNGPLVVTQDGSTSYFVVDGTNKIVSDNSVCDMQPPLFGFVTPTTSALLEE